MTLNIAPSVEPVCPCEPAERPTYDALMHAIDELVLDATDCNPRQPLGEFAETYRAVVALVEAVTS